MLRSHASGYRYGGSSIGTSNLTRVSARTGPRVFTELGSPPALFMYINDTINLIIKDNYN